MSPLWRPLLNVIALNLLDYVKSYQKKAYYPKSVGEALVPVSLQCLFELVYIE